MKFFKIVLSCVLVVAVFFCSVIVSSADEPEVALTTASRLFARINAEQTEGFTQYSTGPTSFQLFNIYAGSSNSLYSRRTKYFYVSGKFTDSIGEPAYFNSSYLYSASFEWYLEIPEGYKDLVNPDNILFEFSVCNKLNPYSGDDVFQSFSLIPDRYLNYEYSYWRQNPTSRIYFFHVDLTFVVPSTLTFNADCIAVKANVDFISDAMGTRDQGYSNMSSNLMSITASYDPDGVSPFPPDEPAVTPADYLALRSDSYSVSFLYNGGDPRVTQFKSRLPVFDSGSSGTYNQAFAGGNLNYYTFEEGIPVLSPYTIENDQVYRGTIIGSISVDSATVSRFDIDLNFVEAHVGIAKGLVGADDVIIPVSSFASASDLAEKYSYYSAYPTTDEDHQFYFFTLEYYFKTASNFTTVVGSDFDNIGVYFNLSPAILSASSTYDIVVELRDLSLYAGVKSPPPDSSVSPEYGPIQSIIDRPIYSVAPDGSNIVYGAGDLEDRLLSDQSFNLAEGSRLITNLSQPLTFFTSGLTFVSNFFAFMVPADSWMSYLLLVSLALGLVGLIFNLGERLKSHR